MKTFASILGLAAMAACTTAPETATAAPEDFKTYGERLLDESRQQRIEEARDLCGESDECVTAQLEARDRFAKLQSRVTTPRPRWNDALFDFEYPLASTKRTSMFVQDALTESFGQGRDHKRRVDYVVAEKWLQATMEARDLDVRDECLLVDRVFDDGYVCRDNARREWVQGTPPKRKSENDSSF